MTAILLLATISIFRMGGDIRVAEAPQGAALHTMGGNIIIGRAAGHVVAKTMGGNIEIRSLDGSVEADTMGGEIRVTEDGRGRGHDLDLYSLGGDIELTLRSDFDGDITVEMERGNSDSEPRITSDFPLKVRESTGWHLFSGRYFVKIATGRTGSGTNHVRIRGIGSSVTIWKK